MAFLIPGFIGLAGVAPLMPVVGEWLRPANLGVGDFGIGPTVYAIMAATGVGMIVSCIRWLAIDHLLQWTGVRSPAWDFRQLENRLAALDYLSDNHYRYYQFYANTLVAILWAYPVNRSLQTSPLLGFGTDLGVAILCIVLFLGSRDALSKYYARSGQLIGEVAEKVDETMTNGLGHHEESGSKSQKDRQAKPQHKPQPENKPSQAEVKGTQSPK
ncbi:MAG: hypothetical protein ABSC42_18780 [Tepidisphaeraceae bacterium]